MTVSAVWVSPVAGGAMDLTTGGVLTETWCDAVASDLLVLGGLDGHTVGSLVITAGLDVSGGNVGIGGAPDPSIGLSLPNTLIMNVGSSQFGVSVKSQGNSIATVEYSAFVAQATTVALAFTCTTVADYHAMSPVKGATSHISNAYGLLVDVINAGETNNYGVFVNTPNGGAANNIGVYVAGGGITVAAGGINIISGGLSVNAGNTLMQSVTIAGNIGFYGQSLQAKPTVSGAKSGNTALASLLVGLATLGLLNDSTSA